MMSEKLISIIVPVYNVEKYIDDCLKSIVACYDGDFEVICVNDGSTDSSMDIVEKYCKEYPSYFRGYSKENGGLSSARNYGIGHANGRYLSFVDSDDFLSNSFFNEAKKKILSSNADIYVCDVVEFDSDTGGIVSRFCNRDKKWGMSLQQNPQYITDLSTSACDKIFRKSLFEELDFPEGLWYEDFATIYSTFLGANKIDYFEGTYYYRQKRSGQITTELLNTNHYADIFVAANRICEYYRENGAFEQYKEELEYACLLRIFKRASRKEKDKRLLHRYVKMIFGWLNSNFPNWRENVYLKNEDVGISVPLFRELYKFGKKHYLFFLLIVML